MNQIIITEHRLAELLAHPWPNVPIEEFRALLGAAAENAHLRVVVEELHETVAALRRTLTALSEHDPSWPDDFLRARAALIGVDATLAWDTVSGQKRTGPAP